MKHLIRPNGLVIANETWRYTNGDLNSHCIRRQALAPQEIPAKLNDIGGTINIIFASHSLNQKISYFLKPRLAISWWKRRMAKFLCGEIVAPLANRGAYRRYA